MRTYLHVLSVYFFPWYDSKRWLFIACIKGLLKSLILWCTSRQPAPIQFGLKLYISKNKQKHLRPFSVLSQSSLCSSFHFSVFIVHRWFISNKIKDVGCITRLLGDQDIYLALFSFEWLLLPDYSKVLHNHFSRALYLQITKAQTPLGSLPLTIELQGPPCLRGV